MGNTIPPEHLKDRSLEPHQRPIFFGHGNVDGIDFWGEAVFPQYSDDTVFGRAVFKKLEEVRGSADSGALQADFELTDPRGRVIADEIQSFTFGGDSSTRWIDCEITLVASHGSDVTLGDTKEGTFGIRLAKELNSPPGRMVNSAGAEGEKEIWGNGRTGWTWMGRSREKNWASRSSTAPPVFGIRATGTHAVTACSPQIPSVGESFITTRRRTGAGRSNKAKS